ncbi:hypothetical protein JCM33774_84960 [Actinophytocola sp. KF-1]
MPTQPRARPAAIPETSPSGEDPPEGKPRARHTKNPGHTNRHNGTDLRKQRDTRAPGTYVDPHPFPGATRHASLPVGTDNSGARRETVDNPPSCG